MRTRHTVGLRSDAPRIWLDPSDDKFWDATPAERRRLVRRASWPAMLLGVLMLVATLVIARRLGMPVRDVDEFDLGRAAGLAALLLAFFAADLVPRAIRRTRREASTGLRGALRAVARERWNRRRLLVVLAGIVAFYATYFSYRNLKSFVPFVREQDGDLALLALERSLFGADPAALLHDLLGTGAAAQVLSISYLFFLLFIPISLGAALILSINPMPGLFWVTALSINWPLGILAYYALPALGPVFVEPGLFAALPATGVADLQNMLVEHRRTVLADPGEAPFVQSIAAFASLHVSIVFSAALVGQLLRVPRALRVALWTFLGLTLLSTVYFGWHYVVDDIAGLAIGAVSVWLAAALTGHRRVLPDLNLPNAITMARILAVPVVAAVVLLAEPGPSVTAAALFAALALSDTLDGHLARARGAVTTLGKVLDPLADKLLVLTMLWCLDTLERLPTWVLVVVLAREAAVTAMRAVAGRRGIIVPASTLGKAKMAAQVTLVLVLLLVPDPSGMAVRLLMYGVVLLTVASAVDYAVHLRTRSEPASVPATG